MSGKKKTPQQYNARKLKSHEKMVSAHRNNPSAYTSSISSSSSGSSSSGSSSNYTYTSSSGSGSSSSNYGESAYEKYGIMPSEH